MTARPVRVATILLEEIPEYRRLRTPVSQAVTPRVVQGLAPCIEGLGAQLLDEVVRT